LHCRCLIPLLLLAPTAVLKAGSNTIDFEGFPDSTILTTQYPGVLFSNAIILTAGISLNEFEFPPRSGSNVASDNGAPMSIDFSTPVSSFSGYFTYGEVITLNAYNAASVQVATATSAFSDNELLSGDIGSIPNEFLQVDFLGGISEVTITGDPAGGSFVMDDVAFASGVPEPSSMFLFLTGVIGILLLRKTNTMNHLRRLAIVFIFLVLFALGGNWLYGHVRSSSPSRSSTLGSGIFEGPRPGQVIDSRQLDVELSRGVSTTTMEVIAKAVNGHMTCPTDMEQHILGKSANNCVLILAPAESLMEFKATIAKIKSFDSVVNVEMRIGVSALH